MVQGQGQTPQRTPESARAGSHAATPKTGQTAMSDLAQQDEMFEQRKMEFEMGRAKDKLSHLELEYIRSKHTAEEVRGANLISWWS
jgi:hypothetical protein